MSNIFLILLLIIISLIFIFLISFYKKPYQRPIKTFISFAPFIPSPKQQEFNPDINTNNWDIHKKRLEKFRRSQYKGLTFFVSQEGKIYYLSEKRTKVYC